MSSSPTPMRTPPAPSTPAPPSSAPRPTGTTAAAAPRRATSKAMSGASGATTRLKSLSTWDRSVEQAGDRAFIGDAADGFGEERGDGEDADLVAGARRFLGGANRIGDDQLLQRRLLDPRHGGARQDAVGAINDDVLRAALLERGSGVAQGPGRIDDVVDEDAEAAGDVADDVHNLRFARLLSDLRSDESRVGKECISTCRSRV